MSSHFLKWLLVSFVHLLPGVFPHSFASVNEPMLRCSVDDLADWLTIQDLGRLVAQWAYKEGITPIRVLHRLENGLLTSAQVHSGISTMGSKGSSDVETNKGYSRITLVHNYPPIHTQHHSFGRMPPLSPVSVLPPPPPLQLSDPGEGLPPKLSFVPPALPFIAPAIRQPFSAAAFEAPRPPPDVMVRISDEVFDSPVPPVSVPVSPRMSMAEVLMQAALKFDESLSTSDINFYKVVYGHNNQRECYAIRTVGNLSINGNYVWEALVTDSLGKEIWRGLCLPTHSQLVIRPGMVITLNYVQQNLIDNI